MRRQAKKSNFLGRFILWSVLTVVVGVLGAGLYGYIWLRGYLKSDAFRATLASQIGKAAKAEATLETLSWSGPDAHVSRASLSPKADQAWKLIEAEGLQATLDFGAARDGVWHLPRISADMVRMDMRSAAEIPQNLPPESEEPTAPSAVPGWLRGWIPTRTQIDEVQVQTFDLSPPADSPGVRVSGLSIAAKPANDTGAWLLRGQNGKLMLPGMTEPFRITSMNSRLDEKALVFHDAVARWLGDSEVTARGDLPFEKSKTWSFNGTVGNLDLRHLLSAEWNSRLSGMIEGDYQASAATLKAKIRVKNGIVQNMEVLDRVAMFTRVDRFRRIVLDAASAEVERAGTITKVTNLKLQSSGLILLEGGFTLQGDQINGDILVGVAPDTLNFLVSTVTDQIFTNRRAEAPGYIWTTVHISGTVNSPLEDLSDRLLIAMGMAPLGVAMKGVELLGKTGTVGKDAAKGALDATKGVLGTGTDVIKGTGEAAGKVIESGAGLLKGLPLIGK